MMGLTAAEQVRQFLSALGAGAAMGLAYEVVRLPAFLFVLSSVTMMFCDLLFFFLAGGVLFRWLLEVNFGEGRWYLAAGVALGWILCSCTAGSALRSLARLLKQKISGPVRAIRTKMGAVSAAGRKGISKFFKPAQTRLKSGFHLLYNRKQSNKPGKKERRKEKRRLFRPERGRKDGVKK